jgi:hypothetical protein
MNYSLRVPAEAKEEIKRAIAFMERHLRLLLPSAHTLREIMKIESDVAKLYYPTLALKYSGQSLGFTLEIATAHFGLLMHLMS